MFSGIPLFTLVAPDEEVLKQVAHKLQRNVFESKRRPVEQLQQMQLLLRVECLQRRDIGGAEGGITPLDDVLQVCRGNLSGRYVEREDLEGQLLERLVLPLGQEVGWQLGDLLGNEEAAVAGESFEHHFLKRELHHFSA